MREEVSLRLTTLTILSVLIAVSAFGYLSYLHTKQTLDFLEGSPTCFPPYILMYGKGQRFGNEARTTCALGAGEGGLRNRSMFNMENALRQKRDL